MLCSLFFLFFIAKNPSQKRITTLRKVEERMKKNTETPPAPYKKQSVKLIKARDIQAKNLTKEQ